MSGPWKPRQVSLSSGGIQFCAQLGVITELLENGMLSDVREWHGCSAGAISAIVATLGASPAWMRTLVETLQVARFTNPQYHCIENFASVWGFNDGVSLFEYMGRVMDTLEAGASEWTFADMAAARPGVRLTLIAMNVSTVRLKRFSAELTPHVRVIDALRASCSIPFYFTPWRDASGAIYCDGATLEYYPWSYLKDKDHTLVVACNANALRSDVGPSAIQSFQDYLRNIMGVSDRTTQPRHWIGAGSPKIVAFDFGLPVEQRLQLYDAGVKAARGFIAWSRQLTDSARATVQTPALSASPSTLSSDRPCPDTVSDTPECRIPPPPACPSRDLHSASTRTSRRWSL
jgi:NTE family protein